MIQSAVRKLTFSIALLAVFLTLALQVTFAQSNATFKIGVLEDDNSPLTNGARLAAESINAAGGVRARRAAVVLAGSQAGLHDLAVRGGQGAARAVPRLGPGPVEGR